MGDIGSIAMILLFQGAFYFAWSPLVMLYPPEALNYSMRSNGMAACTFVSSTLGLFVTFVFPFGIEGIGWKLYLVNAIWNVFEVIYIYFMCVETKGKTLEEMDAIFDGEKHTETLNIAELEHGAKPIAVIKGITLTEGERAI